MNKLAGIAGILGLLIVSGYGQTSVAQAGLRIGGAASNFGTRSLAPGFVPDPVRVAIRSGGSIDARTLNLGPGCIGYVTAQPDFILRMTGDSASLKVRFDAPGATAAGPLDTTLIVNTARGRYVCNDDTNGANPQVSLGGMGAGQYDIWVGSYRAGAVAPGTLSITEL